MIKLSAVIITYNEEKNIERCLKSLLPIADEIIVVDSWSEDTTAEIARKNGARVYYHEFKGHIEQKNYALSKTTYSHVLSIDADEVLSAQLQASILKVKKNWTADGYYFNRLTNYCGKYIWHSSWYPSQKLRLWDKRKGKWGGYNPHDKFIMKRKSKMQFIEGNLLHYPYNTFEDHLTKIDKYSDIYANFHFRNGSRGFAFNIVVNPLWRFFRDYFLKLGFLDGKAGLVICSLSSYETFLKYYKLLMLRYFAYNSSYQPQLIGENKPEKSEIPLQKLIKKHSNETI